ncbi:hypothetical protein MMC31_005732 [Peltigera leucophlebia]|nr:hypothetical protein [Peltigera leucophlebia]
MAPRTPSPNRPKKAEPYNQFTPLATSFSKTSLLTPGGIRINARIESNKKRFPYPSRIPGPATPSGNTTTANNTGDNTVAALDELDTPSRNPRSKKTKSKCNETPILFPYLIQAEGDITSATTTAAHDKKVIRSWGTKEEEHRHCEDVIPCSNISAHEGAVHFGPAFALEGNRFLPLCWGCAEEIVQAEARDKGEMRRGCKCFALDLCFEYVCEGDEGGV